jgi:hypothetical protein
MAILCAASVSGNEVASSDIAARTCQAYRLTDVGIIRVLEAVYAARADEGYAGLLKVQSDPSAEEPKK